MQITEEQLADFLFKSGTLSQRDLAALEGSGPDISLRQALLGAGTLSPDELLRAEATIAGIPFIKLMPEDIDAEVLLHIPEPLARRHNAIAYRRQEKGIEVAFHDLESISALPHMGRERILPRITDQESMKRALRYYQQHLKRTLGDAIAREVQAISEPMSQNPEDLLQASQRLSVVNLTDFLMQHAFLNRAADIHLDPQENGLLVRYRIAGTLTNALQLPKHVTQSTLLRLKSLAHLPLISSMPMTGRFMLEGKDMPRTTITLSVLPSIYGDRMVLHLTSQETGQNGYALPPLGLHGYALDHAAQIPHYTSGLIVVAGAPGSGKSTMLYTLLDLLAHPEKHIVSAEREIHTPLKHVTQIAAGDESFPFTAVIRAALKQDPDALSIAEIYDDESAQLALSAANRGMLVLAAIEAPSAAEGIIKLESYAAPSLIASVLRMVIGVDQVRSLCTNRDTQEVSYAQLKKLEEYIDPVRVLTALKDESAVSPQATWKELAFGKARPCEACDGGYIGRIGLQEVLLVSEAMKEHIKERAELGELERLARQEGMLSLAEDGMYKAATGYTSIEEVARVAGRG